jgi:hypothetical protein
LYNLELDEQQINYILGVLSQMPYREVSELIKEIHTQCMQKDAE